LGASLLVDAIGRFGNFRARLGEKGQNCVSARSKVGAAVFFVGAALLLGASRSRCDLAQTRLMIKKTLMAEVLFKLNCLG
jgi:hypothetical protein